MRILLLPVFCLAVSLTAQARPVLNGIDVLEADGFRALDGAKVGLISNHTGTNLAGTSTALLLHRAKNVDLRILFSPEHGFQGKLDSEVGHARHEATGLRIYSLYTKERKPDAESLRGLDTLVFDIQDIGCRFYTYISTMGEAMKAAAQHDLRFVVLDRPNPINGVDVGGAMRDAEIAARHRFVAWHRIPVRHGMTVGELARMFNEELRIGVKLHVVKMRGWQRESFIEATGQTWINPSPNMRSPVQALLYPGVGLLETTNVSVGRGTDTPFEVLGAPWLDGRRLAARINGLKLPGIRCVPIRFTPTSSKHKKKECGGVRFWVTNRIAFDPILLGTHLAVALRALHPDDWQRQRYNRLLANEAILGLVERGATAATIQAAIHKGLDGFAARRAAFLIYD